MDIKTWTRRAKIRSAGFLAAAFAVAVGFGIQGHVRAAAYRHLLDNGYQHAFAELTTAVSELDTALQKGRYATTPALIASLCTQAYSKALSALSAVGELPSGNVELEQTASFLAKAGDYACYLSRTSLTDGGLTDEHRKILCALSDAASSLNTTLQSLQTDIDAGAVTAEDLETAQEHLSRFAESGRQIPADSAYQNVEEDFPEIPSLIYDGPFSDHIASRSPRALEGLSQVTRDEARAAAAAFLGLRPNLFVSVGDSAGRIPTWGFSAPVDGGELYVEVTRAGGRVLEVISSRIPGQATLTVEEGTAAAARFLTQQGYDSMEATYSIHDGSRLTVNFAAVQEGVICYPDLIKVTVALDTGSIIGFASEGWLMNHTRRVLPQAAVSQEQARTCVAPGLNILSHRLALIPTSGEAEILCHEFKCAADDGRHYILYVNSQTGQEEKLLILLEDERGVLAI